MLFMLSVTNKYFRLSVIMLNVVAPNKLLMETLDKVYIP
jgi:hypothetical protein